MSTSCKKPIWIVVFNDLNTGNRTQRVAAYDLFDLLSMFNQDGQKKIVKIEKTEDEITYHY